jgi:hypothetical protein
MIAKMRDFYFADNSCEIKSANVSLTLQKTPKFQKMVINGISIKFYGNLSMK